MGGIHMAKGAEGSMRPCLSVCRGQGRTSQSFATFPSAFDSLPHYQDPCGPGHPGFSKVRGVENGEGGIRVQRGKCLVSVTACPRQLGS